VQPNFGNKGVATISSQIILQVQAWADWRHVWIARVLPPNYHQHLQSCVNFDRMVGLWMDTETIPTSQRTV